VTPAIELRAHPALALADRLPNWADEDLARRGTAQKGPLARRFHRRGTTERRATVPPPGLSAARGARPRFARGSPARRGGSPEWSDPRGRAPRPPCGCSVRASSPGRPWHPVPPPGRDRDGPRTG